MLEDALLAEQAVTAEGEAVVGREHDDGVACMARRFQCIEDAADLAVEVSHHPVVLGQLVAHHGLGAWPRAEILVAAPRIAPLSNGNCGRKFAGSGGRLS